LALRQRDLHWALPVLERAMGIYCDAHLSNFFTIPAAVARKTTIELLELVAHRIVQYVNIMRSEEDLAQLPENAAVSVFGCGNALAFLRYGAATWCRVSALAPAAIVRWRRRR